jgi:hypothetical protein
VWTTVRYDQSHVAEGVEVGQGITAHHDKVRAEPCRQTPDPGGEAERSGSVHRGELEDALGREAQVPVKPEATHGVVERRPGSPASVP